ncbi:hypothetical protein E2C01_086012 [Portunus trituberculatus]|uniref:Uncharacterized protein n=1 Tax=Portunus trituberculatus TaxID=210409 RepID=A0A5B7JF72_PORTR|nr:hypothetical protein [Portunus trituberculatus]
MLRTSLRFSPPHLFVYTWSFISCILIPHLSLTLTPFPPPNTLVPLPLPLFALHSLHSLHILFSSSVPVSSPSVLAFLPSQPLHHPPSSPASLHSPSSLPLPPLTPSFRPPALAPAPASPLRCLTDMTRQRGRRCGLSVSSVTDALGRVSAAWGRDDLVSTWRHSHHYPSPSSSPFAILTSAPPSLLTDLPFWPLHILCHAPYTHCTSIFSSYLVSFCLCISLVSSEQCIVVMFSVRVIQSFPPVPLPSLHCLAC